MANIVITTTTNIIKVDFNDLSSVTGIKKGCWGDSIIAFQLVADESFIKVIVSGVPSWAVSYNGSTGTLQIDSVDGVAPTSNSDLYNKLVAVL